MLRKSKALILCLMLCIGLLVPFDSKAAGENYAGEFHTRYTEPYCSVNNGYLSVMYLGPNGHRLCTYFWGFYPTGGINMSSNNVSSMSVWVNYDNVVFGYSGNFTNGCTFVFGYYDWNDDLHIEICRYLSNESDYIYKYFTGTPVTGFLSGGNAIISNNSQVNNTCIPLIHWNNGVDGVALNNQVNQIIGQLGNIKGDTSSIISQLTNIYNQNVSINQKLEDLKQLSEQIKAEQEESNTWLEKIFELLEKAPEEEKNQASTQGGNSVFEGTNAIEDKGQGFTNSLNGLVGSMSYNGTDCSWTFPTVKLPAISGVMSETTLIQSQDINFGMWIDAIPSDIMLLIRSLLTMALIVYCFKEFYDTIAYVLTLRGSDNE